MKNLAAKLFLILMTLTVLSAAVAAKTTGYDSIATNFSTASRGESANSESANSELVNSFLGKPTCWLVWRFSDGQEIPVRIPCRKGGK